MVLDFTETLINSNNEGMARLPMAVNPSATQLLLPFAVSLRAVIG